MTRNSNQLKFESNNNKSTNDVALFPLHRARIEYFYNAQLFVFISKTKNGKKHTPTPTPIAAADG